MSMSTMEETNSQEDGSNYMNDEDTIGIEEDNDEVELNNSVLQRLKQNDPTITNLCIRSYFNSVDWIKWMVIVLPTIRN